MINEFIRSKRNKLNITQKDFSDLVDISIAHYARIEKGEVMVPRDKEDSFVKALKLSPEEAVGFKREIESARLYSKEKMIPLINLPTINKIYSSLSPENKVKFVAEPSLLSDETLKQKLIPVPREIDFALQITSSNFDFMNINKNDILLGTLDKEPVDGKYYLLPQGGKLEIAQYKKTLLNGQYIHSFCTSDSVPVSYATFEEASVIGRIVSIYRNI